MNDQDGAAGTAGMLCADKSRGVGSFPGRSEEKHFPLSHSRDPPPPPFQAFYSTGNGNSFPGSEAAVE